jgi:hypothetical protein
MKAATVAVRRTVTMTFLKIGCRPFAPLIVRQESEPAPVEFRAASRVAIARGVLAQKLRR